MAVLLVAIAVAWLVLGRSEAPSPGQTGGESTSDSLVVPGSAGTSETKSMPAAATLPTPVRMSSDNTDKTVLPSASTDSLADAFAGEEIDKEVAGKRTALIRNVVEELVSDKEGAAQLGGVECRTRHCLIKIAGEDQKSVTALVDALQDERGLYGKAESLMMSRDGDEIHMYVRFAE